MQELLRSEIRMFAARSLLLDFNLVMLMASCDDECWYYSRLPLEAHMQHQQMIYSKEFCDTASNLPGSLHEF
jgi:hypothetical protein